MDDVNKNALWHISNIYSTFFLKYITFTININTSSLYKNTRMVYRWKRELLNLTVFSILESNPFNYFVIVSFGDSQLFYQQKGIARGIAVLRLWGPWQTIGRFKELGRGTCFFRAKGGVERVCNNQSPLKEAGSSKYEGFSLVGLLTVSD